MPSSGPPASSGLPGSSGPPADLGPPANSGPPGPPPNAGPSMSNRPGSPGNPPDSDQGNRPHRPPYPPPVVVQPWWWWQVPTDTDDLEPTCDGSLLPANAPAPPPFQYQGQTVTPLFDSNQQQWGFWSGKKWVRLYQSGC